MKKKVLITGLGGFTGQYLAHELAARGHEVSGLAHQPTAHDHWKSHVCDLLDRERLRGILERERPTAVVHLAAIAFVAHGDIAEMINTNVVGTRNLLSAIHESGCRPEAVLLASSANVYGNASQGSIDENVTPQPANDYAVSKLAMEYIARLWFDKLPITLVRPFNYTGRGQAVNFLLPKIVHHFRSRAPRLELGNTGVVRDFSDVRDVVSAYAALIDGRFANETFNVCSGIGHSVNDILAMATEISGHTLEVTTNPSFVRHDEVHRLIGDNRKLRRRIELPAPRELGETLRWMLTL